MSIANPVPPTPEQLDAILDLEGHEPCPGVEILFRQSLGSVPGGPALYATIYRPVTRPSAPAPGLLAFHGGGFENGNPDGCGALAKMLALALGVTTVSASYRLATGNSPTFPGVLDDGLHAWRWLQTHAAGLNVDPARVAVSGESAGVLLAGHLAVASPFIRNAPGEQRPAALIAQWGPVDFVARWYDRGESPGAERLLLGASYETDPALYHRSSVLTHAIGALPPALFIYGNRDSVVHPRQGRLARVAWQAAGAQSELLLPDNIGHGTEGDNRAQRAGALEAAVRFLSGYARF